jgi:hypothetical protein
MLVTGAFDCFSQYRPVEPAVAARKRVVYSGGVTDSKRR